ncbi:MAG: hypothetical protein ACWGN1_05705 [Desulfobulbales bacterium]
MNTELVEKNSKMQQEMQTWQHHLHMHPELAFEETAASNYVASLLTSCGYEVVSGLGAPL